MKKRPPESSSVWIGEKKKIQLAKWRAHQREYKILATTSIKDLIGKRL